MRLPRFYAKIISVVCAVAIAIAGFAFMPSSNVEAAEPDWSTIDWAGDGAGGGAYSNKYKFYSEDGSLVNIQKPGFASKPGLYVTFGGVISDCSLDGYDIQGAGIILHLDNFTKKVTEFTVTQGNKESTCYVYYADGTEEPTGESQSTTQAPTQTQAPTTTSEQTWISITGGNDKWFYTKTTWRGINEVVSVQRPGFAEEDGIYMSTGSEITEIRVNGKTGNVGAIQGAGACVYLSAMTEFINEVELVRGSETSYVQIKNVDGSQDERMDVAPYKSTNTYPTKSGKVFAGWFEDSNFTTPYMESTGMAYAKFVDENSLTVKFQKAEDGTAVRFVSTIDSLDYEYCGFIFTGTYGNSIIAEKDKQVNKVYSSIIAGGQTRLPSVFSDDSKYFFTYTVRNMNANVGSTWNVIPYFMTLDGTKVTGTSGDYSEEEPTTQKPTTAKPTTTVAPTTVKPTTTVAPTTVKPTTKPSEDFVVDPSLPKPFGLVAENPDSGIIRVVWGAGEINCYNLYIDGNRVRTKVAAQEFRIPVSTEGDHTVSVATVDAKAKTESERTSQVVNVHGTAETEVQTTAIPEELMPEIDDSIQKEDGKIILQLNNKTNGQYSDNQIYWIIVGRNPSTHKIAYVDASGNLIEASAADNDGTIGSRQYAAKIVHTLAQNKSVQLPAIESGRMYLSYGEPVYITFNGSGQDVGYAGPDVNNTGDANYNTLFEYLEFTTEAVNGGITFHGNTTRVDFFSFPMIARLTDEYGSYDRCVGDLGTRSEIRSAYTNEVSDKFDTLVTDKRIMCPAKLTFGEGKQYGNYFDDYINRFWSKYANEDLVITGEAGNFRGRTSGDRLILTNDQGTYYVDKPSTQDVFEGRGAFNRISTENSGTDDASRYRAGRELAIEAQLCAAFTRGVAMDTSKWWDVSSYYNTGEITNEYAGFFHKHSVSSRAYGFCYDDVNDQSTLVECGNAERFTIDLKW